MIDKRVYELDYIRGLQQKYASDPGLIERALYAFGLLEAIKSVGMPFCFKGGTSLMLILDKLARLSTDIDILVEPGTDVDGYIEKASQIFPFLNKKEDIRKGKNGIVKRHFRFTYFSPLRNTEFYILLDVVFAHLPYAKTIQKEIRNPWIFILQTSYTPYSCPAVSSPSQKACIICFVFPFGLGLPLKINTFIIRAPPCPCVSVQLDA